MQLYLLFLLVRSLFAGNALKYFIRHKNVAQMSIETLTDQFERSTTRWIEYKYVFQQKIQIEHKGGHVLIVGISKKNTFFTRYSLDILTNFINSLNGSIKLQYFENLTQLPSQKIDVVIHQPSSAKIPINFTRLQPTLKSNLILIYKTNKLQFTKDIFILTFAGSLWIVFFLILALLALFLRISTKKYFEIDRNLEVWTWVDITLWGIAAACQQGLDHTPSGFASCLIFLLGYIMAYLLYTGFTAGITSILVDHVGTGTDLSKIKLQTLHLVALQSISDDIRVFQNQFLVTDTIQTLKDMFHLLHKNDRIGIGPEITIRNFVARKLTVAEQSQFEFIKLDFKYSQSLLVDQNSLWRSNLQKYLIHLNEFGLNENELQRHLPYQVSHLNYDSSYSSAGREHVGSAILLFLAGIGVSILFFIMEMIYKAYKKSKNRQVLAHARRKK